jgi:predicted ATP-grasp superfamily ATP-dependent carboligase
MHESVHLRHELKPLRDPVLIAAFADHSGTTGAATVQYLVEQWGAELVAEIDPDEFFDFTVHRPLLCLDDAGRTLDWPTTRIYVASPAGAEQDVVLLVGIEPSLRWRTFSESIQELLTALGVREAVFVASYPGPTPHTRPTPVRLSTRHAPAAQRFGVEPIAPTYEGPAGISAVLMVQLETAGLQVAQVSTMTPFYLDVDPNPAAMCALVEVLDRRLGANTDLSVLREHADLIAGKAAHLRSAAGQFGALMHALEEQFDFWQGAKVDRAGQPELPPNDDVVTAVERFLKEQGKRGGRAAHNNARGRG